MKKQLTTAAFLLMFAAICILSRSCANTTTPPSGGPKDTIPPVLINLTPENNTTNFPRFGQKVLLLFNEYTVVKDQNAIMVSPPMKKKPSAKVKGKNIVVSFQDSLLENQTYTIDFGQSLADNNEGNIAPRLVYAFSTGEVLDTMYFTGKVLDAKSLKPVKGTTVAIFSDLSDSACFLKVPDAITKTDDWGFFTIRNIRPVDYRVYAYSDADANYKYDPDGDEIAFLDSVFTPFAVVADSIYELGYFDMKDTVKCKARYNMVTLNMFKELQSKQYLQNSGRTTQKSGFLKFSAGNVQINSLEFVGISKDKIILQYSPERDSIDFWINVNYRLDDSLMIRLDYMKTDSTGNLSSAVENLSLAVMKTETAESTAQGSAKGSKKNEKKPEKDTVFELSQLISNETVETDGMSVSSALPILKVDQDSILLTETNPKGQKTSKSFLFWQDTMEIRKYHIKPVEELKKGYEYSIRLGQGAFINLDKLPNRAADINFKVPDGDDLCTLTLNFINVDKNYLVDILNDKGDQTVRSSSTNKDKKIEFKYLKPGKYMIRLTRDENGNGFVDSGNLLKKRQPEIVRFFQTSLDNNIFEIPETFDIEQDIDIKTIFE